jgi:protein-L-isoaspartate(D-aspartate) O-methyltransferase
MNERDSYKHRGLRKKLIDSLRAKNTIDEAVLKAMDEVPRHIFMDSAFLEFAYKDQAFPIGSGQTISQPYTVGFQSTLLEVTPGMKVLEIGTGSGYQCAVLSRMGAKVFSIERQKALYKTAGKILKDLRITAKLFYGDGYKGLPTFAPFDRILVTCGAPSIPRSLFSQLVVGGIMVVPVGEGDVQIMHKIVKNGEDDYSITTHGAFRFVPMLQDKQSV